MRDGCGLREQAENRREAEKMRRSFFGCIGYWQNVPGVRKICRVTCLVCTTPLTVYANVALLPLAKVSVRVPTGVRPMLAGRNGTALKPDLSSVQRPGVDVGAVLLAVTDSTAACRRCRR